MFVARWRGWTWTRCRWRTTTVASLMTRASVSWDRTWTSGTYRCARYATTTPADTDVRWTRFQYAVKSSTSTLKVEPVLACCVTELAFNTLPLRTYSCGMLTIQGVLISLFCANYSKWGSAHPPWTSSLLNNGSQQEISVEGIIHVKIPYTN